jgi:hypothetical protein
MWVVWGSDKDKIRLVSKGNIDGILPIGSYLTIEDKSKGTKAILRVEESMQHEPYSPSPILIETDLSPLFQDQKCQNVVVASRIKQISQRTDGLIDYIKPQLKARRSNQEEIDEAFENTEGIPVFPAVVYSRTNDLLMDDKQNLIHVNIPSELFFHQMLICGKTGSGKTVAMKYLAQYFAETTFRINEAINRKGAVLAINVKEEDLLTMDKKSATAKDNLIKEWKSLGLEPHGLKNFIVYYPGNKKTKYSNNVNSKKLQKITLYAKNIDPESLTGLLQNITDAAAMSMPAIFRYWKEEHKEDEKTFNNFIKYFREKGKDRFYDIKDNAGNITKDVKLHRGTIESIERALSAAAEFFDIAGAIELNAKDILQEENVSVIDFAEKNSKSFGAVLLRDLLAKLYDFKSRRDSDVPLLIIIDEVHEFYHTTSTKQALESLDAICRKGRSLGMGIIFASQNLNDMPKGIESVVNSKIFFKSDFDMLRSAGLKVSSFDPESLGKGFAIASIHGLHQLKFMKFPLSLSGVQDG